MSARFDRIARAVAHWCGTPWAFILSCALVIVWAAIGPGFAWSDTWQLLINTPTTVITFLVLFIVQYTQNRDTLAIQAKLDTIIGALERADDQLQHVEDLTEDEITERRP